MWWIKYLRVQRVNQTVMTSQAAPAWTLIMTTPSSGATAPHTQRKGERNFISLKNI